jgi:hypothetical protein
VNYERDNTNVAGLGAEVQPQPAQAGTVGPGYLAAERRRGTLIPAGVLVTPPRTAHAGSCSRS